MHLLIRFNILVLLVLLPLRGFAAPEGLTVDQLVGLALSQNAELRFYEAEVAAALGRRTQAGLWKNPEISGEYGRRRVSDGTGTNEGWTQNFSITQTFEFPGKGSLRKAIANREVEIAEAGLRQFRLALAGQVRLQALRYLAATANAEASETVSERSTDLIGLLRNRPTAGVVRMLELRVIEADLLELQKSARKFAQEREETRLELNRLTGRPPSQPLLLRDEGKLPKGNLVLKDLILAGLTHNLSLKARTAELAKAAREVSAAKIEMAPDFSVGPFFSREKAGDKEENVGLAFSTSLPLWNWNQGNIAAAEARRLQADALLLEARRKVEAEIARRFHAYELTRKQLGQMPAGLLDELGEASDLADRQYRTGGISVQLYLETQRQFINARQTSLETQYEAWAHLLDLDLLTGGTEAEKP
jgi:cobalt-zinc-cadmium efflux system outer membrane protein